MPDPRLLRKDLPILPHFILRTDAAHAVALSTFLHLSRGLAYESLDESLRPEINHAE